MYKYHKMYLRKYYMKNKRSKIEHSRAKRNSATETVAPVECVFCEENERDLPKMSRNQRVLKKRHAAGNTTYVFRFLMCSMLSLSLNNGEK